MRLGDGVAGEDLVVAEHCEAVKIERGEANQMNAMMRFSPSLKLQLVQQRRRSFWSRRDGSSFGGGGWEDESGSLAAYLSSAVA